jgi:hypothetical protein
VKETVAQSDLGQSFTSGGGFSTYYRQPEWQTAAVDAHFLAEAAAGRTPVDGYYRNNRGYPDLTFAGYNYAVVIGGNFYKVSGTSASAPAVAGLLSNINAARMAIGKGSVGFINPALYANYTSFTNDITSGDNHCAANNICCNEGFYATTGWDPVSGLGSINYGKMQDVFLSLGSVGFKKPLPGTEPTEEPSTSTDPTIAPSLRPTSSPTAGLYASVQIRQVREHYLYTTFSSAYYWMRIIDILGSLSVAMTSLVSRHALLSSLVRLCIFFYLIVKYCAIHLSCIAHLHVTLLFTIPTNPRPALYYTVLRYTDSLLCIAPNITTLQTLAGLTSAQASASNFSFALSETCRVTSFGYQKTQLVTTVSPISIISFTNNSISGVNITYLFSVTSGLSSDTIISRLTNTVSSGLFLQVLRAKSGLAISRLTMFDVHNLSPTSRPSTVPVYTIETAQPGEKK